MKKILLTAVIVLSAVTALAQSDRKKVVVYTTPFVPEHEFRLGIGILPITVGTWDELGCGGYPYYNSEYYDIRNDFKTCAVNLSYSYRVKRWLEVGGVLSYNGDYKDIYFNSDGYRYLVGCQNTTDISFVPMVRFSWYRSQYVRLYSSVGLGITFSAYKFEDDQAKRRRFECGVAFQMVPFGIAVGKKVFGFAEVYSVGATGIASFGIGYRFADKKARIDEMIKY